MRVPLLRRPGQRLQPLSTQASPASFGSQIGAGLQNLSAGVEQNRRGQLSLETALTDAERRSKAVSDAAQRDLDEKARREAEFNRKRNFALAAQEAKNKERATVAAKKAAQARIDAGNKLRKAADARRSKLAAAESQRNARKTAESVAEAQKAAAQSKKLSEEIRRNMAAQRETARQEVIVKAAESAKFQAEISFTQFSGEQRRVQSSLEVPIDGADYAVTALKEFDDAAKRFLGGVSDELKPEYQLKLERLRQKTIDEAFAVQYDRQQAYFDETLSQTIESGSSAIVEDGGGGRALLDETLATTEALIEKADIPPVKREEYRQMAIRAFTEAQLYAEMYDYQKTVSGEYGMPTGDFAVNFELPQFARGLLDFISQPESGGRYNVIYGGETFSDFSKHPQKAIKIEGQFNENGNQLFSTAAGRYQMIYSSWLRAKEALGLADFSPASQDAAAWWLAEETYKTTKPGRDLLTDVATGVFDPQSLAGTWPPMGEADTASLVDAVNKTPPGPPDPFNDPTFEALTAEEKIKARDEAVAAGIAAGTADRQKRAADHTQAFNEMLAQVALAPPGSTAQLDAWDSGGLFATSTERVKLLKLMATRDKGFLQLQRASAKFTDADYVFTPNDGADVNRVYSASVSAGIKQLSDESAITAVAMVNRSAIVPAALKSDLLGLSRTRDPKTITYAYDTMADILENDPGSFNRSFDDTTAANVLFWKTAKEYYTAEEMLRLTKNLAVPEEVKGREDIGKLVDDLFTADADYAPVALLSDFSEDTFFTFDAAAPRNAKAAVRFAEEARTIMRQEYWRYRDETLAREATLKLLERKWGATSVGGFKALVKYPPERYYPKLNGDFTWIEQQLREDLFAQFALPEGARIELVGDTQTNQEIQKFRQGGRLPSYTAIVYDENGVLLPEQPQGRWYGQVTPRMVDKAIAKIVKQTAVQEPTFLDEILAQEEDIARMNKLHDLSLSNQREIKKIRARLREERRKQVATGAKISPTGNLTDAAKLEFFGSDD